jgi:hypothetical protein
MMEETVEETTKKSALEVIAERRKPKRCKVEGLVFQVRPITRPQLRAIVGGVPMLGGSASGAAATRENYNRQEEMYRAVWEQYVDGLVEENGSITAIPYEEALAGWVAAVGEFVLEVSGGVSSTKAEAVGRSLHS